MAESMKESLDRGNPNSLPDLFRKMGLGDFFRSLVSRLYRQVPAASSVQLATLQAVSLPADAKAASVSRATSLAGTVTGELTPVAYGATPATGQVAVAPNGDVVVLAADAITSLDLTYQPEAYDRVTLSLPVASNDLTIPAAYVSQGVLLLISATADVGTVTGAKIVLVPSNSAPATTKANLNLAKGLVKFAVADAVTQATVVLAVVPAKNVSTLLESTTDSLI